MIKIGEHPLTLDDFYNILYNKEKIKINPKALEKVQSNFNFLDKYCKGKVIYGINTGLGPMAQYRIDDKDCIQLQYNAIRSHSSGTGNPIPETYVKSAMIVRLNNFLKGYSGIHPEVVELLKNLINKDIYPLIPEHGGVGASGDLVQLAHLALVLIGEGEVSYQGKILPTKTVFAQNDVHPVKMHLREGLSLINGTSVMTGIGLINSILAGNLLNWTILASAMINEIAGSFDDHFSKELNNVKLHEGQIKVSEIFRIILKSSKLIRKREDHFFNNHISDYLLKEKVQEYYSLRCVPQILGPIYDTIENTEKVLINEANSVSDNPIIDSENNNVYHGGNFHGDYVSLEMDKLKIAITKLSMLCERQLNYLLNDKLNNKLPPFINLGKLGLNFGMQGIQFTATSTVAENQTLSFPMYVHSIPNNNDNQDIVSMGTNASLITKQIIDNSYLVIAIELIAILQAIDYLKIEDELSSCSKTAFTDLRKIIPEFKEDSPKYKDIQNVKNFLMEYKLEF